MNYPKYRIQKTIDLVREIDSDGQFVADELDGVSYAFVDIDDLRRAGYTVTPVVLSPEENTPGTVRKFKATGDLIVKGADSKWRYVTTTVHAASVGDVLENFPSGWGPNETVVTS